jgi:hypothetical protein
LAIVLIAGAAARGLSFPLQSELLASLASMLLFAPASYAAVFLGWMNRPDVRQVTATLVSTVACFIAWNAIMFPGSDQASIPDLLQANAAHWLLFFACGWISLQLAQRIAGIGIIASENHPNPTGHEPGRLSVAKLLALTVACALLAEAVRRWGPSSTNPDSFPVRSIEKSIALTGVLGGLLLGLQWSILAWLRTAGSLRTAGLIFWIAIGAFIRWGMTLPLESLFLGASAYELHLLPESQHYVVRPTESLDPRELRNAFRFLIEAAVQTGLVFLGFRFLTMIGLPIRFSSDREKESNDNKSNKGRAPALPPLP